MEEPLTGFLQMKMEAYQPEGEDRWVFRLQGPWWLLRKMVCGLRCTGGPNYHGDKGDAQITDMRFLVRDTEEKQPAQSAEPAAYGLWNGEEWSLKGNGEVLASYDRRIVAALAIMSSKWQVREIGADGRPLEETACKVDPQDTVTGLKAERDKAQEECRIYKECYRESQQMVVSMQRKLARREQAKSGGSS